MRTSGAGRLAVLAVLLVLLGTGCSPDPVTPPTPSPVAPSPTPTENAQEREQRVAYEAAEKSYRDFRTELQRVTDSGGSSKPTAEMTKTAGGPYLKDFATLVAAYKQQRYRTTGAEVIVSLKRNGYSADSISLISCEDSRQVTTHSSDNSVIGKGELRLTTIDVRRSAGLWKVWSGDGDAVKSCG